VSLNALFGIVAGSAAGLGAMKVAGSLGAYKPEPLRLRSFTRKDSEEVNAWKEKIEKSYEIGSPRLHVSVRMNYPWRPDEHGYFVNVLDEGASEVYSKHFEDFLDAAIWAKMMGGLDLELSVDGAVNARLNFIGCK